MSKKTFLVARREFLENVRTKSFWIGIFLFPVLLTLSIVVPRLLEKTKDARRFAVIDQSEDGILEKTLDRAELPDLGRVLSAWIKSMKAARTAALPGEFKAAVTSFAAMSDAEVAELVQIMENPEASKSRPIGALPAAAVESVLGLREQMRLWWRRLPADEAKAYAVETDKQRFIRVDPPAGPDAEAALQKSIDRGELFAYFVIGKDAVAKGAGCKYVSKNLTDSDLKRWFGDALNSVVRDIRYEREKSIDRKIVDRINERVHFAELEVAKGGAGTSTATGQKKARQFIPIVFVYLLWMAVFMNGQGLLTNTIEEKSNRIIEVMLSSVSPQDLMNGKIFGLGVTGLAVIASWVLFFILGVEVVPKLFGFTPAFDLSDIVADPIYLVSFVLYFLGGYFLYAGLFVGIGSVCNQLKEAQNLMMPLTIVLMVPLMAMFPIAQDPNGALARVLSYVPFFTPFVMMNRAAGPPSTLEYVVTTILLAASILLIFRVAAKVFRMVILMTGKPPRPKDILMWMRAPVGTVAVETTKS